MLIIRNNPYCNLDCDLVSEEGAIPVENLVVLLKDIDLEEVSRTDLTLVRCILWQLYK